MIIALFPNIFKQQSKSIAIGIREFLLEQGVTVVCEDEEAKEVGAEPLSNIDPKDVNFSISLGGDGTILRVVHHHPELNAPIMGVNLGSLGFMADIPVTEIYPSLQDLIDGRYEIQERIMIEGQMMNDHACLAVNEIAVHRAKNPCLIDLSIHVDGVYLNTFSADGIIISTPSGSTAYSLAAGGPILSPTLDAFVITPISPHTLSNRPIVVMPEHEIQIQYTSDNQPVEVSYDGHSHYSLATGEVFRARRAKKKFRLVTLRHYDYYCTLRSKLGWSGKVRA